MNKPSIVRCPKANKCTASKCTHRGVHDRLHKVHGKIGCDVVTGYCPECEKAGFIAFEECDFCSEVTKVMIGPYDNYICLICVEKFRRGEIQ